MKGHCHVEEIAFETDPRTSPGCAACITSGSLASTWAASVAAHWCEQRPFGSAAPIAARIAPTDLRPAGAAAASAIARPTAGTGFARIARFSTTAAIRRSSPHGLPVVATAGPEAPRYVGAEGRQVHLAASAPLINRRSNQNRAAGSHSRASHLVCGLSIIANRVFRERPKSAPLCINYHP